MEEVSKKLLKEGVDETAVLDAIKNRYNVNITYDDYPNANPPVPPSKRYIQVYNYSDTIADNACIRAYQIFGGSKSTPDRPGWKIFRLDRIRSWQPTKVHFNKPVSDKGANIPRYNQQGDKTMKIVHNKVEF